MSGFHFLSDKPNKVTTGPTAKGPTMNGAILVACTTMREVISSAVEAKLGAFLHNGKAVAPICTTLEELGHTQPPTPLQTNNTTAIGISSNNIKQKRSKAMGMRFYWIQDRVWQGQFHIYWKPGKANKADYFTKHHPASHHCIMQSSYIHKLHNPNQNYFECLADNDQCDVANAATGEGVFMSESLAGTEPVAAT